MQNDTVKNLLNKYGIKPQKRLGQNFLIDESVLEKIITAAEISQNDTILEIGPGLGILTFELTKKGRQVIAVEKDKNLARILNEELRIKKIKNTKVISGFKLKIYNSLFSILDSYKIVANLPYYIVSPVIRMFLETENKPELMVLMVQKEVAQRICAKPPRMSILAVAIQFYARPEIVSEVLKTSFYPQPKVDSAILRIKPRIDTNKITNNHEFDTKKFFNLVKAGFSSKRKFLISNICGKIQISKSECQSLFEKIEIDAKSRAENLSIDDWIKIYGEIENIL